MNLYKKTSTDDMSKIFSKVKTTRFIGNNKGYHLTVTDGLFPKKFKRVVQVINLSNGKKKRIEHYVSK